MLKRLPALLFLLFFLPAAAAAMPARPDPSVVRILPDSDLRFWESFGADAWDMRDLTLFPDAEDVLTVIAPELGAAGDCFILRCGGETAMIDSGLFGPANLVPRLLDQLGIERFDFVINTHPHDDHISGLIELLGTVEIGRIYVGFERHDNNLNKRLFREALDLGVPVEQVETPAELKLGPAKLSLYQVPWGDNTNNRSVVARVSLGERSLLLPADVGQSGIVWLIEKYGAEQFRADLLKAPHHAIDRVPPELLEAAGPQMVFITYYPHSRNEKTVKQLRKLGFEPLFTGLGTLVFKTDGTVWTVTQLPMEGIKNPV